MRTTSADYKSAIYATERECRGYIKFNNDSTKLIRGVDGLVSITLHEQLADEERPMFGGACSRYVEVEFFNSGLPAGVSLANSYIDTYMGVVTKDTGTAPVDSIENDTATVEYVWNGRFYISEIDRSKLSTKVVAYDEFSKLNKQYVPTVVQGGSGYAIDDIVEDVLTQAGFVSTSVSLSGYVDELYEGTCRQMLSWAYGKYALGCNVKMSRTQPTGLMTVTLNGAWADKDNAENAVTDNEIYLGGLGDGDPFTVNSVTTGTENNPITAGSGTGLVGENPYLTSANANTILTNVGGITFKPMTIEFRGNPAIDTGDVLKVTSDGNTAYCYVQKMTTIFNGGIKQTIECYGDSEFYYTTEFNPTATHIKAAVSSMAQEIQHDIETADNGVITKVLDLDGSWKELVIANNQDLDSATSVWRWNINGLAHSTSYSGGTYNFAVDMNGRIIANVIQTGILQDALGNNSWNLDTGSFTITNGTINVTTSSSSNNVIVLSYTDPNDSSNWWKNSISPYAVYVQKYEGYTQYRYDGLWSMTRDSGGTNRQTLNIQGNGYASFGGVEHAGEVYLTDASSNRNIWLTGADGKIVLYNRGTYTENATITPKSISLSNGNGNSGAFQPVLNGDCISLTNNGLPMFKVKTDSNGAGTLVIGDGVTNYNRTLLDNTGLTFRDSSNNVTASYPSYGLYAQDMQSRNLINWKGATSLSSYTSNGVTFTVNSDGSVTVSGTATGGDAYFNVAQNLTMSSGMLGSGCPSGGSYSTYFLRFHWGGSLADDIGSGATIGGNTTSGFVRIAVKSGTAMGTPGKTFYPMLRPSSITDSAYYPYAMTNRELTEWTSGIVFKRMGLTLTNQAISITDPRVTANSVILLTTQYVAGGNYLDCIFTVQPAAGYYNVYVRKANGTTIPNNTEIPVHAMIKY